MKITPQTKTFLLGLSISILILTSFFAGALADRIFVVRPLDFFVKRGSIAVSQDSTSKQNKSLLGSLLDQGSGFSVADVAEVASEAVVTVSIKKDQAVIDRFSVEDIFGNPFFDAPGSSRIEQIQRDIGSGFVIEDNLIVTNRHVVNDAVAEYLVIDKNDVEHRVVDIYRDPNIDLAILKVEGIDQSGLAIGDSDQLRVGEGVIAIGTALGEFRHTVTTGVISGLGRGIDATDGFGFESLEGVIQTDAAINPGNSGGPLLNMAGQVIGVNVAVSASGENVGFAIPINVVKSSIDNFNQTGQFERPFLGVRFQMISQEAALANEVPQGAYVAEVVEGSVAAEAGLQSGDIITEFDGQALKKDGENLASIINKHAVGERVVIKYWRNGQETTVEVTLRSQKLGQ